MYSGLGYPPLLPKLIHSDKGCCNKEYIYMESLGYRQCGCCDSLPWDVIQLKMK